MASVDDVFNQLVTANNRLQLIAQILNAGFSSVTANIQVVAAYEQTTNTLLEHKVKQEDIMICELAKISENVCRILSEDHVQTTLQRSLGEGSADLLEMYKGVHAEAALALERLQKIRQELLACCPPDAEPPFCTYEPCGSVPAVGKVATGHKLVEFQPVHESVGVGSKKVP